MDNKLESKEKRERKISLIALIAAFITLVIGFMAYSGSLKIEKVIASRNDGYLYNVSFSKINDGIQIGYITPDILNNDLSGSTFSATDAYINGTRVTNIHAKFTKPGQYAIYKFFVYNAGKEDMYLNDILFKDIPYTNSRKICTPLDPNDSKDSVSDVCKYITLGVIDSNYSYNAVYESVNNIKSVKIKSQEFEKITVIVGYETGAPLAPTPFYIDFGDIEFTYSVYK